MALSDEVGEPNEIFQWLNDKQIQAIKKNPEQLQPVREELADILLYLIRLADQMDIDIIDAARQKIEINESKYPVKKSKASAKKTTNCKFHLHEKWGYERCESRNNDCSKAVN